jgi:DNA adenine methylase
MTSSPFANHHFDSPLRYPGGKRKLANFMKLLFLQNGFVGYHYVEPYCGGGSVALVLLYEGYASRIHMNDYDPSIYAFWYSVLNHNDVLCQRIRDTEVTLDEWHRQRTVQSAKDPDVLDLGFSTFFLNRTNRSGIIKGGVIGGQNQNGQYTLNARFNKPDLIHRIQKVARFRNRITLSKYDAADFLINVSRSLPSQTFAYLDPPYYLKGEGLYRNFYDHQDHIRISEIAGELPFPWVVSYDAVPQILSMYACSPRLEYSLKYSAANRYSGNEIMIFGPNVNCPAVESPANVPLSVIFQERLGKV